MPLSTVRCTYLGAGSLDIASICDLKKCNGINYFYYVNTDISLFMSMGGSKERMIFNNFLLKL